MWEDFKAFAIKGNVVDLAIGLIVGAAFGKLVSSAVGDLLMPPIGKLLGGVDFSNLFIDLSGKGYATLDAATKDGVPVMKYGLFINHCIDFIIVTVCCFMVIRLLSKLKKPTPTSTPSTKDCPECLSVIPILAKKCSHCTSLVKGLLFALLTTSSCLLQAAEAPAEGASQLSHDSEASVVITTGNTTTQTYSVKQATKYQWEQNGARFTSSYLYGKSDGVDKAKKWDLGLRYDREFSPKLGAFLGYTLDGDIFAGFDLRHTVDLGGKYQFFKTEQSDIRSELGYQFQSERKALSQLNITFHLARLYLAWEQKWNGSVSSKLWGEYLQNAETGKDYRFNVEPSLSVLLSQTFSLKLAYLFRYRNLPAEEGKKTLDSLFTTSLVAKF